ncbi:hypothetical protein VTG60DRAFT_6445 [Thermothelomyces hinnuleus]
MVGALKENNTSTNAICLRDGLDEECHEVKSGAASDRVKIIFPDRWISITLQLWGHATAGRDIGAGGRWTPSSL